MKIYTYTEDIQVDTSHIADHASDILYFDIETTGLSAERSDLYLIGYGFYRNDAFHSALMFNDDGRSEPEMLSDFINIMGDYKYLISYNGDTFDIPYIKTKLEQFELSGIPDDIISVDIYKTTRKYKKLFRLASAKQIDIEELVGFRRKSFISGGDLIRSYRDFLNTGSDKLLQDMLTHNHDDIRGLISITEFVNIPFIPDEICVSNIEVSEDSVTYTCDISKLPCRITYSADDIRINAYDQQVNITLPLLHGKLKYYFKDYRNYYYLPIEDVAIHKSMAVYVDDSHKVRATKDTAYTTRESTFIPAPKGCAQDIFHSGNHASAGYIEFTEALRCSYDAASSYIRKLISPIF